MKELSNLIIGPFDNEGQFNGVKSFLEKEGVQFQSSKLNKEAKFTKHCNISVFNNRTVKKYSILSEERFGHYSVYKPERINGKTLYSYWQFNDTFMLKKQISKIVKKIADENKEKYNPFEEKVEASDMMIKKTNNNFGACVTMEISKLQEFYKKLSNIDPIDKKLKIFIEEIFGKELFVKPEVFYKFGDKFEKDNKILTIVKTGPNSCILMDENSDNFSLNKIVKDPNKITEAEFKEMSGHYFDMLKLISK